MLKKMYYILFSYIQTMSLIPHNLYFIEKCTFYWGLAVLSEKSKIEWKIQVQKRTKKMLQMNVQMLTCTRKLWLLLMIICNQIKILHLKNLFRKSTIQDRKENKRKMLNLKRFPNQKKGKVLERFIQLRETRFGFASMMQKMILILGMML